MKNLDKHIKYTQSKINTEPKGYSNEPNQLPYIRKDNELRDLICDFYDSNIADTNYGENIEKITASYEEMTLEELYTVLTFMIRQDRFVEGSLMRNLIDGDLYQILSMIKKKG